MGRGVGAQRGTQGSEGSDSKVAPGPGAGEQLSATPTSTGHPVACPGGARGGARILSAALPPQGILQHAPPPTSSLARTWRGATRVGSHLHFLQALLWD